MRLYLINPSNPLVSSVNTNGSRWNRYRVWKPLSLMVLAGLTPPGWRITIVDENLGAPDYPAMSRPDLVGITAFTSQANRAYEVATHFRRLGVPVVMGGIHATMCVDEVMERVDSVVTGEIVNCWVDMGEVNDIYLQTVRSFYEMGGKKVYDPKKLVFIMDHYAPASTITQADNQKQFREFCREQNIELFFDVDQGVCHQAMVDNGLVSSRRPDDIPVFNRKMIEEFAEGRHKTAAAA